MLGRPQSCRGARDGEVINDDGAQRPVEPAAGDFRSRWCHLIGVLPPCPPAVRAPVAAHPHQQRRGAMPERFVRQPADHRVTHHPFGAALATPRVRLSDPALDHRPIRRETLPDGYETELVEAAERGQIRGREGSVEHVEVFQMDSLGTSIMEDLDPYPETNATTLSTAKSRKNAVTLHEVWADVLACHIAHRAVLDLLVGKVINHAEKEMHSHQRHRDGRDHPSGTRNNGASFLRHETLVSSFDAIAQYDVPAETMPGASRRPGLLSILAFRRAP